MPGTVGVYANLRVSEGILPDTNPLTIEFDIKPRRWLIINDEATGGANLLFKFNISENSATLKPQESESLEIISREIIIQASSASVNYRIQAYG